MQKKNCFYGVITWKFQQQKNNKFLRPKWEWTFLINHAVRKSECKLTFFYYTWVPPTLYLLEVRFDGGMIGGYDNWTRRINMRDARSRLVDSYITYSIKIVYWVIIYTFCILRTTGARVLKGRDKRQTNSVSVINCRRS